MREAERRAEARVGGAIERALREDWSLRRVEAFYKSYADASAPGAVPPAPSDRPAPADSAERGVLFAEDGPRLVVHRDLLTSAGADEKARLAGLLRAVLEQLQLGCADSEARAASSVSADAG